MSKDNKTFDLEDRLIDFAVRIIQVAGSLPKRKVGNHKLHNWKFLVRYSIFILLRLFNLEHMPPGGER